MAATKKNETNAVAAKEDVKPAAEGKEVKTAVPAPEKETSAVKAPEVKAEAAKKEAPAAKAEAPKKEAPKKTAAPKKAAAKAPASKKAPAKKAAVKAEVKPEVKTAVYVQYAGKETAAEELIAAAKKAYLAAGHKEADLKTIDVYVKPEEGIAYYAVNGEGSDDYKIVY